MKEKTIKLKKGLILRDSYDSVLGTYIYIVGREIINSSLIKEYSAKVYNITMGIKYSCTLTDYTIGEYASTLARLRHLTKIEYIAYKSRMDGCIEYDTIEELS